MSGIDCDDVLHQLEHYIDGELDSERSDRLADHLEECGPCLAHAEFQRRLKEIVRTKCSSGSTSSEQLLDRVRASLRSERIAD